MAHLLIVDDDQGIRESVRSALEEVGHFVEEAADGLTALRMLREAPNRMVVLVDLMMPRLDGAGVLGVVAGDIELSRRHAYILMTANARTLPLAFVNLLVNLEVPFLPKPFDVEDLQRLVDEVAHRLN
jgi:CheY-like chemotaxis protein